MHPPAVLLAWAVFAATIAAAAAALGANLLSPGARAAGGAGVSLGWLAYAAVGVVISTRRHGDRIGALLLAMAFVAELQALADALLGGPASGAASTAIGPDLVATWVMPLLRNLWVVAFTLLAILLLVFPTGRSLSPRWRPIVWIAFAMIPVGLVTAGRVQGEGVALPVFPLLESVFGPETGEVLRATGQSIVGLSQLSLYVAAAVSLVLRYRRARGAERAQLKWLAYAALLFAVVNVVTAVIFFTPLRALDQGAPIPPAVFGGIPFILALVAIPVAVGVAILRYRLYDIDVLINRTLVYGAVSAILIGTYATGVVLLQAMLRPFTAGSDLAVAASTLLVVALFHPIRRTAQDLVDRRFYRSRYDAVRTLDSFAARLRDEVELGAVRADLLAAVGETVRPAHASLWLRRP